MSEFYFIPQWAIAAVHFCVNTIDTRRAQAKYCFHLKLRYAAADLLPHYIIIHQQIQNRLCLHFTLKINTTLPKRMERAYFCKWVVLRIIMI